jgi:GNAT superfamily N-acetyltransferase
VIDSTQLAELVEFGEAGAYTDMFAAAPMDWDLRVERFGPAIALVAPQLDTMLFNRVLGLGVAEPASEIHVMEAIALYQQAAVHHFGIQLSPMAQPRALTDWLPAHHLRRADNWAKVYRAAEPIEIHTDLRVESIGPVHAADFAQVACTAFGMPLMVQPWLGNLVGRENWHAYLAFDGELPVACGALFVQGEVGWLGVAGTLPPYRRRGAQGALMAQRIRDAARLGCRWVVTETGEDLPARPNPSFHNMLRTGFTLAYQRPNFLPGR